jgi:folate-binding protein YgfZ
VALAQGRGHLGARVERTGHLVGAFSLHTVSTSPPRYLLLTLHEEEERLIGDLERLVFSDEVAFRRLEADAIGACQGPVVERVLASMGLPAMADGDVVEREGLWVLGRSLTGDPGVVVVGSRERVDAWLYGCWSAGAVAQDEASMLDAALETLRIEAGWVRVARDLTKRRLLPETGLDQLAVSYTKGCYIGQEVIARVRTYGSVPYALRGLVFSGEPGPLPEPGTDLYDADGTKVGQAASGCWSERAGGALLLAYLGREFRTPGMRMTLRLPGGLRSAEVVLLPVHRAADASSRAQGLYEHAIRVFAQGDVDGSLTKLEQALRLDPSHGDAYEAIGVILGRSGRFHEAIDFFRRLEEVLPEEPLVHTNLSLYFMKIGDKEAAEEHGAIAARKSLARGGGASRTAADVAAEAEERRMSDAARKEKMFRQVLDFDPEDAIALFGLGSALLVLGRAKEAVDALQLAVTHDGKNSAIYPVLGKALEIAGEEHRAKDVYRQGIEVASRRGDLMPLKEMQARLLLLGG